MEFTYIRKNYIQREIAFIQAEGKVGEGGREKQGEREGQKERNRYM